MYTLIDVNVGPYDPVEDIQKEIERLEAMPQDEGVEIAIEQLKSWLPKPRAKE